jgi:hypothetical protein
MITSRFAGGRGNIDGFRSKNGIWKKEILPLKADDLMVDSNKIMTIKKFIAKAKENNIKIILTVSPYFIKTPKDLYKPIEKLALENNIKIINHLQDTIFIKDASLFNDILHLNLNGAKVFSKKIASEVKYSLKNDLKK